MYGVNGGAAGKEGRGSGGGARGCLQMGELAPAVWAWQPRIVPGAVTAWRAHCQGGLGCPQPVGDTQNTTVSIQFGVPWFYLYLYITAVSLDHCIHDNLQDLKKTSRKQ